jgi:glycosyltransferase involved in cell wall biosynthesis
VILGVDASRLVGVRTGVARCIESVVKSWTQQDLPFERVRLFSPAPISEPILDDRFTVEVLPSRGPGIMWQTISLRQKAGEIDVLFAPYTLPLAYPGRTVVWNMGILEGRLASPSPRGRARSWHAAHSARRATAVIVNSAATKEDVVRFYGVPNERITVVWPGVENRFRPAQEGEQNVIDRVVEEIVGEKAPYFLFVGKLSPRRNVPALLEAFAMTSAERPGMRLLLVGPNHARMPIEQMSAKLGTTESVRHVRHLEHDALAILYRGAHAFVLPTAQEGFSATILEAAASGCPVVTARHRALEEAGLADAVLCVEPTARHLHEALVRLIDDDGLRRQLGERGRHRARSFSWDSSAHKTTQVLARVAERPR